MAKKKDGPRKPEAEQIDELKIKKIVITNRKEFIALKTFLVDRNEQFMWTSQGSVNSIIHKGKEFISVDLQDSGGRGHHLNRRFKKDIDQWIAENAMDMTPHPGDYKEQLMNLSAIEKNIGKPGVAIDLSDCYWKTAFKLTYIREATYIVGLKKKEWKVGRNACIGSLLKVKRFTPYLPSERGKSTASHKSKPPPIKNPIEYEYIRNHIIGYVYQMFYRLYEEIGDHFFMFLTDCVFTDYATKRRVEKYFESYGYRFKSKPIEFTELDRGQKIVRWFDFEAPRYDDNGNVVGKGAKKYYYYATHQIIDGTRRADIFEPEPV